LECGQPKKYAKRNFYFAPLTPKPLDTLMTVGIFEGMDNIKQIRLKLGLTQAQMANQLGVQQCVISRFERGIRVPSKRTLLAISALASKGSKPASSRRHKKEVAE